MAMNKIERIDKEIAKTREKIMSTRRMGIIPIWVILRHSL